LRRLIDDELNLESSERLLAELVRATPALKQVPFATERIFACVTSAATHRARPSWTVGAIALGIGLSAIAAAAMRRSTVVASFEPSPVPSITFAASAPDVVTIEHASQDASDVTDTGAPTVAQAPPSARVRPGTHSSESRRLAQEEDPARLLEAIRTLRSEGDAVRAGALLADYLRTYPRSPMTEDALALSIEAAVARHDSRSATESVRQYLAEFPTGRYRIFASRAVPAVGP
jgi:hypothetical protein